MRDEIPVYTALTCTEGVTRRGEYQPCDKPAVAYRIDPEYANPYPVCVYHTRKPMVFLTEPATSPRVEPA